MVQDDEERRFIEKWREIYGDDVPSSFTPLQYPPDRFGHLNPELRIFLGEMSRHDVKDLRNALRFYRSAGIVGRFLKWVGVVLGVALGGVVAFGDHATHVILNVLKWFHP